MPATDRKQRKEPVAWVGLTEHSAELAGPVRGAGLGGALGRAGRVAVTAGTSRVLVKHLSFFVRGKLLSRIW